MPNRSPPPCPSEEALVAYASGGRARTSMEMVDEHVAVCGRCQEALRLFVTVGRPVGGRPLERPATSPRYRLLETLGSGGQGDVWRARDTLLGREVALKVVSCPEDAMRHQLVAEARALAALSHEHVLEVYDIDVSQNPGFIAIPICDRSLADELRTPVGWREARATMQDVAAGLEAVHEAGLIHGDIKPANLLRDRSGTIKIGDFGLTTAWQGPRQPPRDRGHRRARGTPGYIAPEIEGGGTHTRASDQYAFFVTFAQLLDRGVPPGREDGWKPRFQDVPSWLVRVIHRGLSTDPSARFPSMNVVGDALRGPRSWVPPVRTAIGTGLLVAASAVAVLLGSSSLRGPSGEAARPRPDCRGLRPRGWSETMQARIQASGHPRADQHARELGRTFTTFSRGVKAASVDYCRTGRHEAHECLNRVAERFDAVAVHVSSHPTSADDVRSLMRVMPGLTAVDHCERVDERMGAAPASQASSRSLAAMLVHTPGARELLGGREPSYSWPTRALMRTALGMYPDLEACQAWRTAAVAFGSRPREGVEALLQRAEELALRADAPRTVARFWLLRAAVDSLWFETSRARESASFAAAAIVRAGNPAEENAILEDRLAIIDLHEQEFTQALRHAQRSSEIAAGANLLDRVQRAEQTRGRILIALQRWDQALPVFEASVPETSSIFGPHHSITNDARRALGEAYIAASEPGRALGVFESLVVGRQAVHADDLQVHALRGVALAATDCAVLPRCAAEHDAAKALQRAHQAIGRALELLPAGMGGIQQAMLLANRGRVEAARGRFAEASRDYGRARALARGFLPQNDPALRDLEQRLACTKKHAVVERRRSVDVGPQPAGEGHLNLACESG